MRPDSDRCEILGCDGYADWFLHRFGRVKHVCTQCRDEMIAIMGWQIDNIADVLAAGRGPSTIGPV